MDHDQLLRSGVESLSGHRVQAWERLKSSPRNVVVRATLDTGDSIIVKAPTPTGLGGVRERAALQVLDALGVPGVPRLVAAGNNPRLLLLEDLGHGPSVADHMLGDDPARAAESVRRWAESVARVQGHSLTSGERFGAALSDVEPGAPLDTSARHPMDAAKTLAELLPPLGVDPVTAALDEFVSTAQLDEGPHALTPGDACPDNNVERDGRLALIDFEQAEYRHVAWEAAYLAVPWPTCWCSWRLPEEVTDAALAAWRATLTPFLPPGSVAGLAEAVRRATVAWALLTTAWQLPQAMTDDAPAPPKLRGLRPDRRAVIQHRLSVAVARTPPSSDLHRLAAETLHAVRDRWGACELALAPAWR